MTTAARFHPARSWLVVRRPSPVSAVVIITVLATALRLATADVQSIWLDEALAMRLVTRGFGSMLAHLPSDQSTPPLYYVLLWPWSRIFGTSGFAFRSFSVLAGTLTVPLIYLAGRRFSSRAGLWAAGLAAVSPLMFYYSQEVRPYALFILFSAGALVAWQQLLDDPRARTAALWAALSVLALLTHYCAVFPFLGEASVVVWRLGWRRVSGPVVVMALVGTALVPLAVSQTGQTDWIARTSFAWRVAETAKEFVIGPFGPLGIVFAPMAALMAGVALLRLTRDHGSGQRRKLLGLGVVGLVAVALPALLAITGIDDIFKSRNLVGAWIPWAVLVAVGLAASRAPRVGSVLGAALCVSSLSVIVGTDAIPAYQRDDWRDAARSLSTPVPGGRIVVTEAFGASPLRIYLPTIKQLPLAEASVSTGELDFVTLKAAHTGLWWPGEDSLGSPIAPARPADPPAPFRLVSVRRTDAYATYRFRAPATTPIEVGRLRVLLGNPNAVVVRQP